MAIVFNVRWNCATQIPLPEEPPSWKQEENNAGEKLWEEQRGIKVCKVGIALPSRWKARRTWMLGNDSEIGKPFRTIKPITRSKERHQERRISPSKWEIHIFTPTFLHTPCSPGFSAPPLTHHVPNQWVSNLNTIRFACRRLGLVKTSCDYWVTSWSEYLNQRVWGLESAFLTSFQKLLLLELPAENLCPKLVSPIPLTSSPPNRSLESSNSYLIVRQSPTSVSAYLRVSFRFVLAFGTDSYWSN